MSWVLSLHGATNQGIHHNSFPSSDWQLVAKEWIQCFWVDKMDRMGQDCHRTGKNVSICEWMYHFEWYKCLSTFLHNHCLSFQETPLWGRPGFPSLPSIWVLETEDLSTPWAAGWGYHFGFVFESTKQMVLCGCWYFYSWGRWQSVWTSADCWIHSFLWFDEPQIHLTILLQGGFGCQPRYLSWLKHFGEDYTGILSYNDQIDLPSLLHAQHGRTLHLSPLPKYDWRFVWLRCKQPCD